MISKRSFLPAVSPESSGIPSGSILRFIERLEAERICIHGFLVQRFGRIVSEGYWSPYKVDMMHRMYSVSKSFVSLAIGLMIDEGRLSLDDTIVDFFADVCPEEIHPYIKSSTIRDLLMMATAHSETSYKVDDKNWIWTFFNKTPSHPPGTIFSYDTSATVVLDTIVERISGKTFLEYMRPKLLDPIGFSKKAWCIKTPEGNSWGGSGVICTLRDMSKIALLCLDKGRWNGKQLISEEYMKAAVSKQIDNSIIYGKKGYGYQIWCERNNGFSFRGMGSQLAYCMPDKDFIFTCIADTQGDGPTGTGIVNAMWQELYDSLSDSPLPEDHGALQMLNEKIEHLSFISPKGEIRSDFTSKINNVTYVMNDNPMGIKKMRIVFQEDTATLDYTNSQGDNQLRFGMGKYVRDSFPQKNYFGDRIGSIPGMKYVCHSSAVWVEPHKLNIIVYITDNYLGTLKISVAFKDNEISVYMTKVAEWFLNEYQGFAGGKAAD